MSGKPPVADATTRGNPRILRQKAHGRRGLAGLRLVAREDGQADRSLAARLEANMIQNRPLQIPRRRWGTLREKASGRRRQAGPHHGVEEEVEVVDPEENDRWILLSCVC